MRLFVDCPSTNNLIYEHYLAKFRRWEFVDEIVRRLPIYEHPSTKSILFLLLLLLLLFLLSNPLAIKGKKKKRKRKMGVRR